jgi:hypothetical protein
MVVAERAVIIELAFSSACIIDGMLTKPTAAKPNVHLLTFINCSFRLFFIFCFSTRNEGDGLHFVGALDIPLPKAMPLRFIDIQVAGRTIKPSGSAHALDAKT